MPLAEHAAHHVAEEAAGSAAATIVPATAAAAAPVIEKYTGVLAAADIFTPGTAFQIIQSIRLDLGYGSQVHP